MLNSKFDYKACVANADDFYEIGCLVDKKLFKIDMDGLSYRYASVFAVNVSFACELYLKALIENKRSTPPFTHKQKELFSKLQEVDKNLAGKIEKEFNDIHPSSPLERVLEVNDNSFNDFRYLHESAFKKKAIHSTGLVALANILKDSCHELL